MGPLTARLESVLVLADTDVISFAGIAAKITIDAATTLVLGQKCIRHQQQSRAPARPTEQG
jgi:hypothetical protein